jgi:hypothetical protein
MTWRTTAQVALLFVGLVVWGYGSRSGDGRLTLVGLGCFAVAFVLRLIKRKVEPETSTEEPPPP